MLEEVVGIMIVFINSPSGHFTAGPSTPVRVAALTGISSQGDQDRQRRKVAALVEMEDGPDIISDLSILSCRTPLWRSVLESGKAVSTLPIYTAAREGNRVDQSSLLDTALWHIESGVGLLTIHPTPTHELVALTSARLVPWTSRGGGMVIRDLLSGDSEANVYLRILPEIVEAAKTHGTVLSLGASFRSANIFDARDKAQLKEIESQLNLAREISAQGVGVIVESPGHARPSDIQLTARQLASAGFPVMPLGPIPTDAAEGFDHVGAAIGATIMGMEGAAHILSAVTREEHTGGVPSIESTIEAVRSAKIAAHIIDMHQLGATDEDALVVDQRVRHRTCVAGKQTHGCSRCGPVCPL